MPSCPPTLTVAPGKINDYLLDIAHAEGGSKARWFLARGFRPSEPQLLATCLVGHAVANWPITTVDAALHGNKHRIVAPLACPDGSAPTILAVWLIERDGAMALRHSAAAPPKNCRSRELLTAERSVQSAATWSLICS